MELLLERLTFTSESTIGRLTVDGSEACFTLEDPVRDGPKIPGKTAIPEGRYRVILSMSPRFKKELPLLQNVPGFEGVRIHTGNTAKDTAGCILVGLERGKDEIRDSHAAMRGLMLDLREAQERREVIWITIKRANQVA